MGASSNLILGTAGHIDHGKSRLILALTGTDPDRLAEEKKRGITIELGFAQLELPSGTTMGVVDVPGHERFIRQMVQGATGVDVALLVIAADDGVMPQTKEHLAVLQLLGVSSCVVALTKIDLVDEEWLAFIRDDVESRLSTTPFAGAPIVPCSAVTGAGLDELRAVLDDAAAKAQRTKPEGAMRMPIDRVFTVKGFGTVVTGTLWSGEVQVGDELELLGTGEANALNAESARAIGAHGSHASNKRMANVTRARCATPTRVRTIQMHGRDYEAAVAGNRVALCLAGLSTDDVHVGDFLAAPGAVSPSNRFDASFTYLDPFEQGKPLKSGSRVHICHGTREVIGRILCMRVPDEPNVARANSQLAYRDNPTSVRASFQLANRDEAAKNSVGLRPPLYPASLKLAPTNDAQLPSSSSFVRASSQLAYRDEVAISNPPTPETLTSGETSLVQIRLEGALPVSLGDRFIVRSYSPARVIGGGTVVLTHPRRRTTLRPAEARMLTALASNDANAALDAWFEEANTPALISEIRQETDLPTQVVEAYVTSSPHVVALSAPDDYPSSSTTYFATPKLLQKEIARIESALKKFHALNPTATGINKDALRQQVDASLDVQCFDALLSEAEARDCAVTLDGEVSHPQAGVGARVAEQKAFEAVAAALKAAGSTPPTVKELADQLDMDEGTTQRALRKLAEEGRAIQVEQTRYYDADNLAKLREVVVAHIQQHGPSTAAALKEAMGITRKFAMPLLEYFDDQGVTHREADLRSINSG